MDKELHELTSGTPALTDITPFGGPTGGAELKKSTWQSIRDVFKTSFDSVYQAILVSGTNIRTLNGTSLLGSGNLTIPALTDGDKGDITVSSGATVWTIDPNVVTNAKLSTVATNTIKGRSTAGTGNVEDLTPTQVAGMLPTATTSTAGTMSASDKTKLDGLSNEWTIIKNDSFTAGGTYDSGSLSAYTYYKIEIVGTHTGAPTINMRVNNISTGNSYHYQQISTNGTFINATAQNQVQVYNSALGSGYVFKWIGEVDRATNSLVGSGSCPFNASQNSAYLINSHIAITTVSSIQLSTITGISGTIKIYGKS